MSLTIEQVRVYIKAVDSGRIEKRPLDGMQGLARLAIAQDEELARLRGALTGLMTVTAPILQNSYPKSKWAQAWFDAEFALGHFSAEVHRRGSVTPETGDQE